GPKLPGAPIFWRRSRSLLLPFLGPLSLSGFLGSRGLRLRGRDHLAHRQPGRHLVLGEGAAAPPISLGPAHQRPALPAHFSDPLPAFPESGLRGSLWNLHPDRGAAPFRDGLAAAGAAAAPGAPLAPSASGAAGRHGSRANPQPAPLDRKVPGDQPGGPDLLL